MRALNLFWLGFLSAIVLSYEGPAFAAEPQPPAAAGKDSGDQPKSDYAARLAVLLEAADKGRVSELQRILKEGADVNDKDDEGETALMHAAASGHEAIALVLLGKGALVNERSRRGETALIKAADNGQTAIVKLLLAYNQIFATPEETLKAAGVDPKVVSVLNKLPTGEILVDVQDEKGQTALFKACRKGHGDIVTALIWHNADIRIKDKEGNTVLMILAAQGNADLIKALNFFRYSYVEPLLQRDAQGRTPLMLAAAAGSTEVVELLLNTRMWQELNNNNNLVFTEEGKARFADYVDLKDRSGKTALQYAEAGSHHEVVECLKKARAKE
jgi:ankyrin repeat protein